MFAIMVYFIKYLLV